VHRQPDDERTIQTEEGADRHRPEHLAPEVELAVGHAGGQMRYDQN